MPKKQPACSKSSKTKTQSITCAARVTPIKATLESVIANPTILKKPKDPRLPAVGTKFVKRFKGKDLEIEVKEDGLYWEGKRYKSLSGLAMAITEYPISGYVFSTRRYWNGRQNSERCTSGKRWNASD